MSAKKKLFITDLEVREVVTYKGCRSQITKLEAPHTVHIRNLDYPKAGWITVNADINDIEKSER